MPTNSFFNNFGESSEQELLEDLVIEAIQIYGIDMYYVPRSLNNYDPIYGADDVSSFDQAYQIEMYVKSYDSFQGDGNLMSKFGLEIRDQVTFSVATRVFHDEISRINTQIPRPNEGDLIYYPLDKKLFEIKYVEKKVFHYPMGMLPTYDLHCELFEYSAEDFDTGIDEIDTIEEQLSLNVFDYAILTQDGRPIYTQDNEPLVRETYNAHGILNADNTQTIQTEREGLILFSETNPFSEEFDK